MKKNDLIFPRRALVSVSDKTDLAELASSLVRMGIELVSTGTTAEFLRRAGLPVVDVSSVTDFPELLDGRVKTLHPKIHAGILADRGNSDHLSTLTDMGIEPIDLVIVNLYPFTEAVEAKAKASEILENIDIGGPALVRAAAKNFGGVIVVSSPSKYPQLLEALTEGGVPSDLRRKLAAEAFTQTSRYDSAVSSWFTDGDSFSLHADKSRELRYGENQHQRASLFISQGPPGGLASARVLQGKDMSYNNYLDAESAIRAVSDHSGPTVAIVKHQNPCGIASNEDLSTAFALAHRCDPLSAFGGVVAVNRSLDEQAAKEITKTFFEVIVAPGVSEKAMRIFARKEKLRVIELEGSPPNSVPEWKQISGGLLVQDLDREFSGFADWKLVSGKPASASEVSCLEFAWRTVRSVKSNAVVLTRGHSTVGIGMGQVNRLDSARLAVERAGDRVTGSVAASDAFFPFPDGLKILLDAGVQVVVQPGGSNRDQEVIDCANRAGVTMYFTGERHFSH